MSARQNIVGAPSGNWDELRSSKATTVVDQSLVQLANNELLDSLYLLTCNIPNWFKAIIGLTTCVLQASPNPFLGINPDGNEFLVTSPHYCEKPTRSSLDLMLRSLHGVDSARALYSLLTILAPSLLPTSRKLFIEAIDGDDKDLFQIWKAYFNVSLSDARDPEEASRACLRWWNLIDRLYEAHISILLSALQRDEDATLAERLLEDWRTPVGYFSINLVGRDDVILREKLLHKQLTSYMPILWERRRILLGQLLRHSLMNLGSFIDLRLLEFETATSYEDWLLAFSYCCRTADVKGVKLRSAELAPKVKFADSPRYAPPPVFKEEQRVSHDHSSEVHCSCRYCKEPGHDVADCPKLLAKHARDLASGGSTSSPLMPTGSSGSAPHTSSLPQLSSSRASSVPYTTRSGRTSRPPATPHPVLVTSVTPDPILDAVQEDNQLPYSDSDVVITLRTQTTFEDVSSMPTVPVRVQGVLLTGLIDSASTVNFMTQSAFDKLRVPPIHLRHTRLTVSTMAGCSPFSGTIAALDIALCDDDGYWTETFPTDVVLCPVIPGGYDVLLNVAWLSQCEISLIGESSTLRPRIARSHHLPTLVTSGCQASDSFFTCSGTSLITALADEVPPAWVEGFDLDPLDVHGRREELRVEATAIGILLESELRTIWDGIRVPHVELSFKQGQESPPIRRRGFPQSGIKTEAARAILAKLVDMGVLAPVPRGSGRFTSPGFVVPKPHSSSFRFVVDYGPVNDRLLRPSAMHHHSAKVWSQSIPSTAVYYAVLDMKDAFFNVPLSSRSQDFLHVDVFDCGQYKFLYMPQGLMLASAVFTELIENISFALREFLSNHPLHADLLQNCHIILYVDDILICGADIKQVGILMKIIIQVLSFGGLCISKEKIQLPSDTVRVMGVMLRRGHIFADPEKISQILNLQRPTTRLQLQSCLGLLNYCRSTIRPPELLRPLQLGLNSKRKFEWTSEMENAWILVVQHVQNFPLSQFCLFPGVEDVSKWQLLLQSDASNHTIGYSVWLIPSGTDLQDLNVARMISEAPDLEAPDSSPRLISIGFRALTSSEVGYAAHDREALGVYTNLMRHKALVHLFPRTIYQCDNVISVARFNKRALPDEEFLPNLVRGRRWLRWFHDISDVLYLTSANSSPRITFLHVPGPDNGLCDFLSRYIKFDGCLVDSGTQTETLSTHVSLVTTSSSSPSEIPLLSSSTHEQSVLSDALRNGWSLSLDTTSDYMGILLVDIYAYLRLGHVPTPKTRKVADKRFSISADGLLRIHLGLSSSICVPHVLITLADQRQVQLRSYLIWYFHEGSVLHLSHRGYHSVLSKLRSLFHWNRMDLAILNWIGSCLGCVASKGLQFTGTYSPRFLSHVNQLVALDFAVGITIGNDRYFVLVIVDAFSGFCMLLKSKDKSSLTVAKGIIEWSALFGVPSALCHDNEPSFRGEVVNYLKHAAQLPDLVSPTFSPMTQGSAERTVRIIKEGIFAINSSIALHPPTFAYDCVLSAIAFANNSTPRADDISPFQMMLGREPQDFMSLRFTAPSLTAASRHEYVSMLTDALETVRSVWESKANELKTIRHDRLESICPDLAPGDDCVRVAYMNGQRLVFDQVVSVTAKIGSNTYLVRSREDPSATPELVHGYQLHKLESSPQRAGWSLPPASSSSPPPDPVISIRSALRAAPVGTLVGTMYRQRIYIGETTELYLRGDHLPILFYLPCGGDRFQRPSSSQIDRHLFVTHLSEVIKVGVCLSPTGICNVAQFD